MPHIGRRQKWLVPFAVLLCFLLMSCGDSGVLLRGDPPITGFDGSLLYSINSSPNGGAETNQIVYRGVNDASPMPLLSTAYGRGASATTQTAQLTSANGTVVNVLAMNRIQLKVGLTEYLDAGVTTYEQRDALGNRVCGAKVRLDFKPNLAQAILQDEHHRAWDSLFYYNAPCKSTSVATNGHTITKPDDKLDLAHAKFMALVIDEQFTPRVTGDPIIVNRGHSVTIVGGVFTGYIGGWWESTASLVNASDVVAKMTKDLDQHEWLRFGDSSYGGLVYSAGDADVYASLQRLFLNRQSDYLVNFRSKPSDPWRRILVNPVYNTEWNDLGQNWHALTGQDMPKISDLVDKNTGIPHDLDKPDSDNYKALKEIETAGCQNCPNPELEQIRFMDATDGSPTKGKPLYAMTIRGYLGSQSSLVLFGNVPGTVKSYQSAAEAHRTQLGMNKCPIRRDADGNKLSDDQQYSADQCTNWLREGALWDLLTHKASSFGFDTVAQFSVRDNSSWASHCTGSGDDTYCTETVTNQRLDASYLFSDTGEKLLKSWTVLQLLGEVGMRMLGLSYASTAYGGSGLDFAMAQPAVYNSYYTDMADTEHPYNPEMLFALDARALQLPNVLGQAEGYLYGLN